MLKRIHGISLGALQPKSSSLQTPIRPGLSSRGELEKRDDRERRDDRSGRRERRDRSPAKAASKPEIKKKVGPAKLTVGSRAAASDAIIHAQGSNLVVPADDGDLRQSRKLKKLDTRQS